MATKFAEHVAAHRARKVGMALLDDVSVEIQERLAADMRWTVTVSAKGKPAINWDMSAESVVFLREYAEERRAAI